MAGTPIDIPISGIQSPPVDLSKPINPSAIHGLTILITGGASGLGAAFARHWASHGANVIIGDLNHQMGEKLIADLRATTSNPHHHFLSLDVTSWPSQVNFFEEAVRLSPTRGIDCVVANAGINLPEESLAFEVPPDYHSLLARGRSSSTLTPSSSSSSSPSSSSSSSPPPPPPPKLQILDVNLTGVIYTVHLAHAYLPLNPGSSNCSCTLMPDPSSSTTTTTTTSTDESNPDRDDRDRHLLLVSSMAGLHPLPTQSLYSVSKHAVTGLFRNLRLTSPLRQGIRVNLLCPYFTATPILGRGLAVRALMAGMAMSQIESVVDAATRLVADRRIIGRSLAVGPKARPAHAHMVGLVQPHAHAPAHASPPTSTSTSASIPDHEQDQNKDQDQSLNQDQNQDLAVWEIYAHDFEQSELFTRRLIALINLLVAAKGWFGLLRDLAWSLVAQPLASFLRRCGPINQSTQSAAEQ